MSYNSVPPPASLTENRRRNWGAQKASNSSPAKHSSSGYRNDARRAKQAQEADELPDLMETLNMDITRPSLATPVIHLPVIEYSEEYMKQLRSLVFSKYILQGHGYVQEQLSKEALEKKKKCDRCGKSIVTRAFEHKERRFPNLNQKEQEADPSIAIENKDEALLGPPQNGGNSAMVATDLPSADYTKLVDGNETNYSMLKKVSSVGNGRTLPATQPESTQEPILRCKFHNGKLRYKIWSCCGQHVSSEPCQFSESHVSRNYPEGELEERWRFYPTDTTKSLNIRPAIAIDCEMGAAKSGDSELIRITVIDYFTSAVLIDSLVWPDVEMDHYNTRYSGVTRSQMNLARREGKCFSGRDHARKALWEFVGPKTVVVGHSANNDLSSLRWIHPVVVDTMLIELYNRKYAKDARDAELAKAKADAEVKAGDAQLNSETQPARILNLTDGKVNESHNHIPLLQVSEESQISKSPRIVAAVEESKVGLKGVLRDPEVPKPPQPKKIKGSGPNSLKTLALVKLGREIQMAGNKGHDSLEDAFATRDLAHWNVVNMIKIK